ncbi:MAG: ATP-binding protein [Candidatus Thiodiazotropha endolucinida]
MEAIDLSNPERPRSLQTHPIYTDRAILPTRALEACVNAIKQWIDNLLPGGIVYARQRHGKTFSIEYLTENINLVCGFPLPVGSLIAWEQQQHVSETRFYTEILDALGYELSDPASLSKLRRRTFGYIEQQARDVGSRQFLLFIDEAQEANLSFYKHLIKLHNELNKRGVRLIVVLFGQPELVGIRANMIKDRKGEIVGRFMTGVHELTGIVDLADLTRMYQSIDTGSEYPIGSGFSYLGFYCPRAFANHFRLADHVERVWHWITQVLNEEGLVVPKQISMQAIMSLTRWLLIELSAVDDADLVLTDKMIQDAIDYAARLQLLTDALTEES